MITDEHSKVADMVLEALKQDVRCRNDDLWLILSIWQKAQQIKLYVPYDELKNMAKPESITRARRKIQNELGLYKAREDVSAEREANKKLLRDYYAVGGQKWKQ